MKLHLHQKSILRKLMYNKGLQFTSLQPTGISSKHYNYHLQQLIKSGFIEKSHSVYDLTNEGKKLVGRMTDDASEIEENPKITVWLYIRKKKGNHYEYLITRRTKQPYYGKIGWICGKALFGETFEEAAARELFEETGLTAEFSLSHMYHKVRYDESGRPIQDALFVVFIGENPKGELNASEEGELFWISKSNLLKNKCLFDDVKSDFDIMETGKFQLIENVKEVEKEF